MLGVFFALNPGTTVLEQSLNYAAIWIVFGASQCRKVGVKDLVEHAAHPFPF